VCKIYKLMVEILPVLWEGLGFEVLCTTAKQKINNNKLSCLTEEVGSGRIAEVRVFSVSIGMNFWVGMLMWVV
jgi:hypothetical protein